ncbi:hypothetical protein XENOCAPTIV_017690, partial [Xenoophorus captivus]
GSFQSSLESNRSTRHHGLVERVQRDRRFVSPVRPYRNRQVSFSFWPVCKSVFISSICVSAYQDVLFRSGLLFVGRSVDPVRVCFMLSRYPMLLFGFLLN